LAISSGEIPGAEDPFACRASACASTADGGGLGSSPVRTRWSAIGAGAFSRGPPARWATPKLSRLLSSRGPRWGVTLALLACALSQLDADQLAEFTSWKSVALLLASAVVLLVVIGFNTVRWVLVARICRVKLPWWQSFQWTMIGHFFNQVFPSSIGGDVIRGVLAGRGIDDMGGAFSSIALERVVGLVALLALITIGQPLLIARLHDQSLSHLALAIVVMSLAALATAFVLAKFAGDRRTGRLQAAAHRIAGDARRLMTSPLLTGSALLVSFAMHGSNLLLTAAIANELGADISLLDVLLVVPTIILIASLPISIGGWGVREAALAIGFSAIGQPPSVGVATSLIIGLANFVSALPGAAAWNLLPPVERGSMQRS
jgi:glycosyltransferase 2 family protein